MGRTCLRNSAAIGLWLICTNGSGDHVVCAQSSTAPSTASAHIRLLGVYDERSGEPVAGAIVTDVLSGDHASTSETGTVSLWFVRAKGTVIEVRKLGYERWASAIDPADTVPITVLFRRVVKLSPIVSNASANIARDPGVRDGFEARCASSHVACVRESDLADHVDHTIGDFLLRSSKIACGRGPGCGVFMHPAAGTGYCTPTYFVDGFVWDTKASGSPIDNPAAPPRQPFNPSNVKQIEIYGPNDIRPLRFAGDEKCGVVLLWTK